MLECKTMAGSCDSWKYSTEGCEHRMGSDVTVDCGLWTVDCGLRDRNVPPLVIVRIVQVEDRHLLMPRPRKVRLLCFIIMLLVQHAVLGCLFLFAVSWHQVVHEMPTVKTVVLHVLFTS